ncbi:uncharacterized protein LOC105420967 [Amborella trichopoda]|uniref:uncharacterized protein LOC105420967 n=1 Tax=Amborella trichopoda TaxID=13333 RepID=UPI0005D2DE1A|nr:uncharacterized protein LOC105420967 [Amborella trichopoda]|eukprot:XP_011624964.1 uncharacterized protein LOC105420967 [Amborella trichopoda]
MLTNVARNGHFSGFQMLNGRPCIFYLQYADDTLIFCEAQSSQVTNIVTLLKCCEVALGLKVNFEKTSVVGLTCSDEEVWSTAQWLGCKVEKFPITYLGMLLSDGRLPIAAWDKILQRIQVKLDLWKFKYLSFAGKVTFIKACLSKLSVYQMSILQIPSSVARKIETTMRNFLWGSSVETRKFRLLRWDRVCTPKKEGGLGIRKSKLLIKLYSVSGGGGV